MDAWNPPMLHFGAQFKVKFITIGKSRQQGHEASGCTASTAEKQKATTAQLAVSIYRIWNPRLRN